MPAQCDPYCAEKQLNCCELKKVAGGDIDTIIILGK
jgi:hypothetical protein